MLHALLSLFPIDRRDADRAARVVAAAPFGPAIAWLATVGAGIFALLAATVIIGGAA